MHTIRRLISALLLLTLAAPALADRLADIKARGTLLVGVSDAIPPFTFRRGNEIVGYDVDLVRGVAQRMGVKAELVVIAETDRVKAAQDGRIDLIASTFTRTPERERALAFSLDIFSSPQVMITDKAANLTTIRQMSGRKFGVLKGRTSDENIREVLPTARFVYLDDYISAFEGLRTGAFDAFAADNLVMRTNLKKERDAERFFFLPDFKKGRDAGFGLKLGEPALKAAIDDALLEMEKSGEALAIYNVWFGPRSDVPIERALRIGVR